ncbi:hypothetical protein MKEN_00072600 [Mycena kentingensis (nom. inval.)]|nr:hypothetical protein MKEN_00072600 [Mycena kentingensis (nom. inval.)]
MSANDNSPNSRIHLLSGLRTNRSAVPHTAGPAVASFNVPRVPSGLNLSAFPPEDDDSQPQSLYAPHPASRIPMTAAVDGPGFMRQQQQQQPHQHSHPLNPNSAVFTPFMAQPQPANQAFQMQLMQLELMKMQAAQQYQAQLLAQQAVIHQQQVQSPRRVSFQPPATAGPLNSSFDLRSAAMSAQIRRGVQLDEPVPMTASLDGKFGSRIPFNDAIPGTPTTTIISGGTSLGSPASNNVKASNGTPSKSDSTSNWRRGGNNNSVLSGNNRSQVTPPSGETAAPSPTPLAKSRPQPLSFNAAPLPRVTIEAVDGENDEEDSLSSGTNSDPTTPSSNGPPLSPREEASKKLYEGLGIGRPVVSEQATATRVASQPVRQPRGPPQAADELGTKNFAFFVSKRNQEVRRKAIGGLGVLMNSRERRGEPYVVDAN